jgi:hypothetical protein
VKNGHAHELRLDEAARNPAIPVADETKDVGNLTVDPRPLADTVASPP